MDNPPEQPQPFSAAANHDKVKTAGATRIICKRNLLRCCSCAGAALFFITILAASLIFTVFRPREPLIWLNSSTVKLNLINGTALPQPGSNATINADVSMKNGNFLSFKHPSATSKIYYRGAAIGEARMPAGKFPARRTKRVNVTVDIVMDRVIDQPDFGSDMETGLVAMSWYTRIGGRAKFWIVKKHVTFKMNCTASVNLTAQPMKVAKFMCKPKFKLF